MVTYLPSSAQALITVEEAEVATELTISAPFSVVEGESFSVSGKLTRVDTGEGLSGQPINVYVGTQFVSGGTTDGNGNYSCDVSIAETGSYTLEAEFEGASGLAASRSGRNIMVGGFPIPDWFKILAPLMVGGVITYFGK